MQILGSGLALFALTWGLGRATTFTQLSSGNKQNNVALLFQWMKWVIPAILLVLLIGYIYSTTIGK